LGVAHEPAIQPAMKSGAGALKVQEDAAASPRGGDSNLVLVAPHIVDCRGNFRGITLEWVDKISVEGLPEAATLERDWHLNVAPRLCVHEPLSRHDWRCFVRGFAEVKLPARVRGREQATEPSVDVAVLERGGACNVFACKGLQWGVCGALVETRHFLVLVVARSGTRGALRMWPGDSYYLFLERHVVRSCPLAEFACQCAAERRDQRNVGHLFCCILAQQTCGV